MAADLADGTYLEEGELRAWVAPPMMLRGIAPPDGDPDRLLLRPDCRVLKLQRKVVVGRVETPAGALYVKRYTVFAWRVALAGWWRPSPAFRAWAAARALAAGGFGTPEVVAAVEYRRSGWLRRSFFLTREVTGAVTADVRWQEILADPLPARRRSRRRIFARTLGTLFRRLHSAGLYHNDLKDVNVLVRGSAEAPACILLDLEGVTRRSRIGRRRRVKNLVQLDRTLGRCASGTDRLRFLRAYLDGAARRERHAWAAAVRWMAAAKDRGRRAVERGGGPRISCTIACQDEEAHIAACLESVSWCDEIVVVDGGSRDRTVEIAHRFTDRVIAHPWPGYRAQKQFALEAATGDWVLNLDADERVTVELAAEIRAALTHVPDAVHGFAIPRLVAYLGRWWYRGGWYPRRIVRLVRRRATRWGGVDPHERPLVLGRVGRLEHPLLHYTYTGISDHLRTVRKLTEVAAEHVSERQHVGVGRLIAEPAWRFFRSYVIKRGALEGLPGLFVAATDAFYTFLRWARVWEQRAHRQRR